MNHLSRIAAAVAIVGLGLGAVEAAAQNAPAAPAAPSKPPVRAQLEPLTAEQVKTVISGRLITMRSDLKVGKVTEKDANTYDVELLKADGTVAEHALVDKVFAHPTGALLKGHHRMHGRHGGFGPGDCPKGWFGPGMGPRAGGPGADGSGAAPR